MPTSVHPHACGEHPCRLRIIDDLTGSSPRMWGTRRREIVDLKKARFIPTHVGNTSGLALLRQWPSVHPHACGEHQIRLRRRGIIIGSSPRMWGTLIQFFAASRSGRFIPTHVGNTPRCSRPRTAPAVHPHACGEHKLLNGREVDVNGSSPRMWGTPSPYLPKQEPSFLVLLNNLIVTQHISRSDVIHSCSSLYSDRGEINLTKKQAKGPPLQG